MQSRTRGLCLQLCLVRVLVSGPMHLPLGMGSHRFWGAHHRHPLILPLYK